MYLYNIEKSLFDFSNRFVQWFMFLFSDFEVRAITYHHKHKWANTVDLQSCYALYLLPSKTLGMRIKRSTFICKIGGGADFSFHFSSKIIRTCLLTFLQLEISFCVFFVLLSIYNNPWISQYISELLFIIWKNTFELD